MQDLKDIQGLDEITIWPLGIGWCVVLMLGLGLVLSLIWYTYRYYKYKKSWQYIAYNSLLDIKKRVGIDDAKTILQDFNIQLKKIAMQHRSRQECASLYGNDWLKWLEKYDPTGFKWQSMATILLAGHYQPQLKDYDVVELDRLINAAQAWVRKC